MTDRMSLGDISPIPSKLLKRSIGRALTELAAEWNSPETPSKPETIALLKALVGLVEGDD